MNTFSINTVHDPAIDSIVVVLSYTDPKDPQQNLEARVAPEYGSNLYSFILGDTKLIYCDYELLKNRDFTGDFVLWPLPNRLTDRKYTYSGKEYSVEKYKTPRGNYPLIHGLVQDAAWEVTGQEVTDSAASVSTTIAITEQFPYFEVYPFPSHLTLTYTLTKEGLRISYNVSNDGTETLPFGYALHPYFTIPSGPENTVITVPVRSAMDADEELIPTGKLLNLSDPEQQSLDVSKTKPISELALDHLFDGLVGDGIATIDHMKERIKLRFKASEEFTKYIVYTMEKATGHFCLENQTCATNFLNMHAKAIETGDEELKQLAGLLEVEPGKEHSGYIDYLVERY